MFVIIKKNEEGANLRSIRIKHDDKHIYDVYDNGKIYDVVNQKYLKTTISKGGRGYEQVYLYVFGGHRTIPVHRLLMMLFNPVEGMEHLQVNHIDGNRLNNNLDNLEWCTCSENQRHAVRLGLSKPRRGEKNNFTILKELEVVEICELLQSGESVTSVAKRYDHIKIGTIYAIYEKAIWLDVVKNYHFHRKRIHQNTAHKICQMILDGCSDEEIIEKFDIDKSVVRRIKSGDLYRDIAHEYGVV